MTIGENVFIGSNVTILQGGTVGRNSVIGAGCLISKNIPENTKVSMTDSVVMRLLKLNL